MITVARYRRATLSLSRIGTAALLFALLTALAIGVIVIVDRAENRGLSDAQLDRIAAACDERASIRSARRGVPYDEVFDRCEDMKKGGLNPDPFPPN